MRCALGWRQAVFGVELVSKSFHSIREVEVLVGWLARWGWRPGRRAVLMRPFLSAHPAEATRQKREEAETCMASMVSMVTQVRLGMGGPDLLTERD